MRGIRPPNTRTADTGQTPGAAEVLDAARSLLRAQGADGLTMRNLAIRLRSSPDALACHFPTIRHIHHTLAAAHQRQMAEKIGPQSGSDLEGLRNLLLDIATHECPDTPGHLALQANPALAAAQDPVFQLLYDRMRTQLDRRVAVGAGHTLTLTLVLWTAVHRNTPQAAPPPPDAPGQKDGSVNETLVDLLLIGLRSALLHPRSAVPQWPSNVNSVHSGRTIANLESRRAIETVVAQPTTAT